MLLTRGISGKALAQNGRFRPFSLRRPPPPLTISGFCVPVWPAGASGWMVRGGSPGGLTARSVFLVWKASFWGSGPKGPRLAVAMKCRGVWAEGGAVSRHRGSHADGAMEFLGSGAGLGSGPESPRLAVAMKCRGVWAEGGAAGTEVPTRTGRWSSWGLGSGPESPRLAVAMKCRGFGPRVGRCPGTEVPTRTGPVPGPISPAIFKTLYIYMD